MKKYILSKEKQINQILEYQKEYTVLNSVKYNREDTIRKQSQKYIVSNNIIHLSRIYIVIAVNWSLSELSTATIS